MSKAVLTARIDSEYDDLPEFRYHFPRMYLNQVREAVGEFILYYEPRRNGGRQAYFASARIEGIQADPKMPDHYYALISNYLELPDPVPFRERGKFFEASLAGPDGRTNLGAAQRAVRLIPDIEFDAIVQRGCGLELLEGGERDLEVPAELALGEPREPFQRPIIQSLISRPFRDRAFTKLVRRAYRDRCALTGLRIINGGGRPEIDAAHIQPVSDGHNGPDSIRNGLALSKTAHWLFDRGLISIADDLSILVADKLVPAEARRLLNPDGQAIVPKPPADQPHRDYLRYHRERLFKG